jgi:ornithine cyclodeaminase
MSLPFIDGEELLRLLPIPQAVEALERAFADPDRPETPRRSHVGVPGGELLLMPASGDAGTGVKLVTVAPENPSQGMPLIHAVYLLFDAQSLAPVAAVDGGALTALRTCSVSALATRHLARPDAERLVLFGAGVQATAHLDAMLAVRPVSWVRVVSRSPGPAERLIEWARHAGLDAAVAGPDVVSDADLVCTCTTSAAPVFDGSLLRPGVHVNAVGSYRPDMRELDDETIRRAAAVVVETVEAAMSEAGELIQSSEAGVLELRALVELDEVVRGRAPRRRAEDVTVFKSVGVAFEDLAVAGAAMARR